MKILRLNVVLIALFSVLVVPSASGQQQPPTEEEPLRLSYLYSDGNLSGTLASFRSLLQDHPELSGRVELNFLTESFFDDADPEVLADSDVLVLDMMNQVLLDRFNEAHDIDLIEQVSSSGLVLAVGVGVQPLEYFTEQGAVFDDTAMAYWQHGGLSNRYSLMKLALGLGGIADLSLAPVQQSLDFGYYYPDETGGQVFADWQAFESHLQSVNSIDANKPRVAVGFYKASYYGGETDVIDAVIAEIERQGGIPIPFFGYPGQVAFNQMLLDENGQARADVGLSFLMRFANFESSQVLSPINIPIINLATLYGRSEQEWRESDTGMSMFEGTYQIAVPELAGLVAPTVVGSRERQFDPVADLTITVDQPIPSRIEMAVKRGMGFARLSGTPPAERRVALMYYNYPVGEANIGASYLNIAKSLATILQAMRDADYELGEADLSADAILADISKKARNIGVFAPGELQALVNDDLVARIPVSQYSGWLDELAPELRNKIIEDWGAAEDSELMVYRGEEEAQIIVPRLEYGNIILMPQPARGWSADLDMLYHAEDLAPHHQYVAAYTWLRETIDIDAIVHMGTHGTLEWLDGKDAGLSREDAPDALIGAIPNLNIYNVDVVGEGLIARRRGMATLIDHMVPPFKAGGLYEDLARLSETINDYHNNLHKNVELSAVYARQIVEQLESTGIAKSLDLNLTPDENGQLDHEAMHAIQDHMVILREEFIPFGLHSFGSLPEEDAIESTVQAIFRADRSQLPESEFYYSQEIRDSIVESADREIASLLNALDGGYIGGGTGGEPIRNPDAYPTGKNFYGIDPEKVPKKAAWELGVKLADQMLADHLAEHGSYPRKVSFVIWGDETMRHEGIVESQIFHLLGTRPVWDSRDKVVDVEVVPSAQLGRPRIDIVIASAAEGMFNNVTVLMDEAVQRVKALEEAENYVRDHYLQTRATLIDMGYDEEEADRRAGVRIFDEPPGTYNLNTSRIAAASGSWNSNIGMVNDYINKMGHGFGNGYWGEPMQDVFKLALEDVEKVVHSSSTMLYGALDNDDFFMYMGGLAAAIEEVDGNSPELLVTNTRNPSRPEMSSIDKFIGMEFNSRYVNPNWIQGMQAEGYAGARTMVEFVEYLWGWDATVTDVIDDRMWQESFEVYVQDKHELDMDAFFDNNSPYAFQDMSARMIETIRKDYWQADQQTLTELLEALVDSVDQHGISCSDITCGNPRLLEYVLVEGERAGLDGVDLANFRQAVEAAIQANIEELARVAENFAETNDAQIQQLFESAAALEGFRMEPLEQQSTTPLAPAPPQTQSQLTTWLLQALVLLGLLFWWWRRRYRVS